VGAAPPPQAEMTRTIRIITAANATRDCFIFLLLFIHRVKDTPIMYFPGPMGYGLNLPKQMAKPYKHLSTAVQEAENYEK
jgi:hypothetical protein